MGRDIYIGVIAGVIATAMWTLFDCGRRRFNNHRHFDHLEGLFSVEEKLAAKPEPYRARVTVANNVLKVEYKGLEDGRSVSGAIEMSERFPKSGRGHYSDITGERRLWGLWEVQVVGRSELLVHSTYTSHKTFQQVTHGYVWKRI